MSEAADLVAQNALWYHTLDLGHGVVTPGWFDLRSVVDHVPWPDVAGKRCLDVGTYDGFFAFELERRGASEVVATDVGHHSGWDWLPRDRARGVEFLASVAGEKGRGFEVAAEVLSSKAQKQVISVYDLSPETVGEFDVVVCGSLLLHLRDPLRALDAIRSVCRQDGSFLSMEQVDPATSVSSRRTPRFKMIGTRGQWIVPNVAAHREMLRISGFDVVRTVRPYAVPHGTAHPGRATSSRRVADIVLRRAFGGEGVPMSAALTRRAV